MDYREVFKIVHLVRIMIGDANLNFSDTQVSDFVRPPKEDRLGILSFSLILEFVRKVIPVRLLKIYITSIVC